jgi:hypothetical protein
MACTVTSIIEILRDAAAESADGSITGRDAGSPARQNCFWLPSGIAKGRGNRLWDILRQKSPEFFDANAELSQALSALIHPAYS